MLLLWNKEVQRVCSRHGAIAESKTISCRKKWDLASVSKVVSFGTVATISFYQESKSDARLRIIILIFMMRVLL